MFEVIAFQCNAGISLPSSLSNSPLSALYEISALQRNSGTFLSDRLSNSPLAAPGGLQDESPAGADPGRAQSALWGARRGEPCPGPASPGGRRAAGGHGRLGGKGAPNPGAARPAGEGHSLPGRPRRGQCVGHDQEEEHSLSLPQAHRHPQARHLQA